MLYAIQSYTMYATCYYISYPQHNILHATSYVLHAISYISSAKYYAQCHMHDTPRTMMGIRRTTRQAAGNPQVTPPIANTARIKWIIT